MNPARIYLIEPSQRDYMNVPIIDHLEMAGIDAVYYNSIEDLHAAGDSLNHAEVLISSSAARSTLHGASRLKAIVNPYTGSENIDRNAANERGILIANGATVENCVGVAEATILLLLACFFDLSGSERILRERLPRPMINAHLLMGKTVGIVGYGQIGQAVIKRLLNWDIRLLVSAPRLRAPLPSGVSHVDIETLLAQSDAVLVLCSLSDETRNLLSGERLRLMKPSAVLVNTARGGILDEDALADMLQSGRLRRAALDAFNIEPLPADSSLRAVPNITLTPHMIGHTIEAEESMARTAAESTIRVLRGQLPVHVFNPEICEEWLARHVVGR